MGGMLPRNRTRRTISALILLVVLPSLLLAACSRNRAAARGGAAAATTSSLEEIADSSTTTTVGAGSTITGNSGVNGAPPSTGPEASSTTRRSSSTVTSGTTRRTTTTTKATTTTRPQPKLVKLTIDANRPDGSTAHVTSAPGAISCPGGACSDSFAKGTSITLTADPQESGPTWVFSDGRSPCFDTSPTCTFDLTAALTVTINFAE
jgi:predicted small secreted protein